jgi:uncharacterized repeat protein (TIGR03803 family)
LIVSGNTLYGTAAGGGSLDYGTIFAINTDGMDFTNLHSFSGNDGAYPAAGLILSGNTLYGTTIGGGNPYNGTVFAINTDGTRFSTLHSFPATSSSFPYTNSDGATPQAGLILSGNTLYGTTIYGGDSGNGTVFSISFSPQLNILASGTNVILTWPTNVAGFDYTGYSLESTTNLGSAADWSSVTPRPVVLNGQNVVTNPISGTQIFFRLAQSFAMQPAYTIGGTISNLTPGDSMVLWNNCCDSLAVTANGSFTFATPLPYGSRYYVYGGSSSEGAIPAVTNGTGTVGTSNITSVVVTCSPIHLCATGFNTASCYAMLRAGCIWTTNNGQMGWDCNDDAFTWLLHMGPTGTGCSLFPVLGGNCNSFRSLLQ